MGKVAYEPDELVVVCLSRAIKDGDEVTVGTGTPLPGVAYMLARRTHAPNTVYRHPHGGTLGGEAHKIGIALTESLVLRSYVKLCTGTEIWDYIQSGKVWRKGHRMVEFFRPAQVDMYGNLNSTVIGDFNKPKVRLPSGAGIADLTSGLYWEHLVYVPRHSREVFVAKRVDFITGVGYLTGGKGREKEGIERGGPSKVITDLGIFDFEEESKRMRLISIHPGVTTQKIKENTGFDFLIRAKVEETEPPTRDQLDLIKEIDPLGVRKLEMLSGKERRETLLKIILEEKKLKLTYQAGGISHG